MKAHPFAALFPMLPPTELAGLVEDIRVNGLREPITVYEGHVLDGRNRAEACQKLGITPPSQPFTGSRQEALRLAWSMNFKRRHLTHSQAAACVVDFDELVGQMKAGPQPGNSLDNEPAGAAERKL